MLKKNTDKHYVTPKMSLSISTLNGSFQVNVHLRKSPKLVAFVDVTLDDLPHYSDARFRDLFVGLCGRTQIDIDEPITEFWVESAKKIRRELLNMDENAMGKTNEKHATALLVSGVTVLVGNYRMATVNGTANVVVELIEDGVRYQNSVMSAITEGKLYGGMNADVYWIDSETRSNMSSIVRLMVNHKFNKIG